MLALYSSEEGSLSTNDQVQFVLFWITCLSNSKDKRNETDNSNWS